MTSTFRRIISFHPCFATQFEWICGYVASPITPATPFHQYESFILSPRLFIIYTYYVYDIIFVLFFFYFDPIFTAQRGIQIMTMKMGSNNPIHTRPISVLGKYVPMISVIMDNLQHYNGSVWCSSRGIYNHFHLCSFSLLLLLLLLLVVMMIFYCCDS